PDGEGPDLTELVAEPGARHVHQDEQDPDRRGLTSAGARSAALPRHGRNLLLRSAPAGPVSEASGSDRRPAGRRSGERGEEPAGVAGGGGGQQPGAVGHGEGEG